MEKDQKNKNIWLEILRFVIVGGGATLIDFVCEWAIIAINANRSLSSGWTQTIAVTVGFLVSTVFNYLLSLIWVFKNVKDEKKARSKSYMLYFVIALCGRLGDWDRPCSF
jgi:putative flippase GtrA